eukprot:6182318-Pleurochrysis_carterae.AAC.1
MDNDIHLLLFGDHQCTSKNSTGGRRDDINSLTRTRRVLAVDSTSSMASLLAVNACHGLSQPVYACHVRLIQQSTPAMGCSAPTIYTLPYRIVNVCYALPLRYFRGSECPVGNLIFDLYCLIVAKPQQYEYRFCPRPLTPYHGEGGTGMSNCCNSPTHIFDEHYLLAVSYVAKSDVEEAIYIPKARLIILTPVRLALPSTTATNST